MELNKYIDHTLLKQDASRDMVKKLCEEAKKFNFATVCVNPYRVKDAKKFLEGTNIGITTVVGFPLGATLTECKVFEAKKSIDDGADEIDMVINIGAIKDNDWEFVENDIRAVKEAIGTRKLKVILENCLLELQEMEKACRISIDAKVDFVKTSTGFSKYGAIDKDVAIMKLIVGDKVEVKAAGGVKNYEDAIRMIEAGATRIGTSGGVQIMQHKECDGNY